jgi:alkanesulfonate monooxygenase SsuD/methylene tetrahydromethanopterin reductase-like flavin-dependent oxidoreductase (luciferase family)
MRFGVATAIERTTPAELRSLWQRLEQAGYDTLAVWDHFEALRRDGGCLEAVAMHAALAMSTTRVRCGCLVYAAAYRPAAVLAHVAATIDLLSDGRAFIGLGAGWYKPEHVARGLPFDDPATRSDRLEEVTDAVSRLLHSRAPVTMAGHHVELLDAIVEPRPAQAHVPV